jgi:flagellar protein FlbD
MDGAFVILLTRLGGPAFALNQDLIERADSTPDTVITLVDGTKYVVAESLADLVELVRRFRASVISTAQHLERPAPSAPAGPTLTSVPSERRAVAAVVPLHRREL